MEKETEEVTVQQYTQRIELGLENVEHILIDLCGQLFVVGGLELEDSDKLYVSSLMELLGGNKFPILISLASIQNQEVKKLASLSMLACHILNALTFQEWEGDKYYQQFVYLFCEARLTEFWDVYKRTSFYALDTFLLLKI